MEKCKIMATELKSKIDQNTQNQGKLINKFKNYQQWMAIQLFHEVFNNENQKL